MGEMLRSTVLGTFFLAGFSALRTGRTERWVDMFDEIGNISSSSTVMTTVKEIITLGVNIATGFDLVSFGIPTERT